MTNPKNFKKGLLGFLSLSILLSAAACGNDTAEQPSVTKTEATEAVTEAQQDNYPYKATDYNGRTFTVWSPERLQNEFWSEGYNSSKANDVVYDRNLKVENYYNIKIEKAEVNANHDIAITDLKTSLLAGDKVCDLINIYAFKGHNLIMQDLLTSWTEIDNIDMTQPWWDYASNEASTFYDTLFLASGASNQSAITNAFCMFYNMDLLETYYPGGKAELHQAVIDGKWTLDVMQSYTKDIYQDLNGDGARDMDDLYGFMAFWCTFDPIIAAFGENMTGKDEDGNLTLTYMNEKTVAIYEKMYRYVFETEGTYAAPEDYGLTRDEFIEGHVMFIPGLAGFFASAMGEMEDDYGILPYPKWDEAQDQYYTICTDGASMVGIPYTADAEYTAQITDILNYYSYLEVIPVNLDIMLKDRYTRDPETAKIIDMFIHNRKYEFAVQFSEPSGSLLNRLYYLMRDLVSKKNIDIVSKYEKAEKRYLKGIEEIMEHYQPK